MIFSSLAANIIIKNLFQRSLTKIFIKGFKLLSLLRFKTSKQGHAKRNYLRHYNTRWQVAGLIPDGILEFSIDLILPAALRL
jgi:hypothetical protein